MKRETQKKRRFNINSIIVLALVIAGLTGLVGCKSSTQDSIYQLEGTWSIDINIPNHPAASIELTLQDNRVYYQGQDVGKYQVHQVTMGILITRALDDGTVVQEEYQGDFKSEDSLFGAFYRTITANNFLHGTFTATRQ